MFFKLMCCKQRHQVRVSRVWWMRLIPYSRLYKCDLCGTRHLVIKRTVSPSIQKSFDSSHLQSVSLTGNQIAKSHGPTSKHLSRALRWSTDDINPSRTKATQNDLTQDPLLTLCNDRDHQHNASSLINEEQTYSSDPLSPIASIPTPFSLY